MTLTSTRLRALVRRLAPAEYRADLEHLVDSPEVQRLVGEIDDQQLQRRQQLATELAALPGRQRADLARAHAAAEAAGRAVEEARQRLAEAMDRYPAATSQSLAISTISANRAGALEAELRSSADRRVLQLREVLLDMQQRVRHGGIVLPAASAREGFTSNHGALSEAAATVRDAVAELHALELRPLAGAEVSQALQAITQRVNAAVRAAGLDAMVAFDGDESPKLTAAAAGRAA